MRCNLAFLGLSILLGCGASGGGDGDGAPPVDLGERVVGDLASVTIQGPARPEARFAASPDSLRVEIVDGAAGLFRVDWRPDAPGPLDGAVVLLDDVGIEQARWRVEGVARVPELLVHPPRLTRGAPAIVWAWAEGDREVRVTGPGGAGVTLEPRAGGRGLPARFVLSDPARDTWTSVRVATCDHPTCAVELPIDPAPADCGPLYFEAAPVGEASTRRLSCDRPVGPMSAVDHPDLSIEVVEGRAFVTWRPVGAGPLLASLQDGERAVPIVGYAVEAEPCAARLPETISFGPVGLGGRLDTSLWLENHGATPCLFSGVEASGEAFSALDAPPAWLDPGQAHAAPLRFTPAALGPASGEARVFVPRGAAPVALLGDGVDAALTLVTPEVDIGRFDGCGQPVGAILVANEGGVAGTVEVLSSSQGFRLDPAPRAVAPGEVLELYVTLDPDRLAPGPVEGQVALRLGSDGSTRDVSVVVRGEWAPAPDVVETFQQLSAPKTDLLLVVDSGPQMAALTATLTANMERLADFATSRWQDVTVAVARVDSGRLRSGPQAPGVLAGASETFRADLVGRVLDATTAQTAPASRGLATALHVLTSSATNRPADWPRADGALSLVFISARDDASANEPEAYANALAQVGASRGIFVLAAAIAGPAPQGCVRGGFAAEHAERYAQVADRAGGVFLSICSDVWFSFYDSGFGYQWRFFLTRNPVQSTVEVEIAGEPTPARAADGTLTWTYDIGINAISFPPARAPRPGSTVVVRYAPECQ